MAAEEDVPPLEDMSELLHQVDAMRELKNQQCHTQVKAKPNLDRQSDTHRAQKKQEHKEAVQEERDKIASVQSKSDQKVLESNSTENRQQKSAGFGGMKKGFLFGGPPAKQNNPTKSASPSSNKTIQQNGSTNTSGRTLEDIPFIKKQQKEENERLRFSEVQEAMEKTNAKLMENKEWVTDDLLENLEKNEKLSKRLQDPTFLQAIGEFQKNPEAALRKYANNKEVQEFFTEFCGLMGQHFTKLGDQTPAPASSQSSVPSQPLISTVDTTGGADLSVRSSTNPHQATAADEARMQQILSDPEIRLVLMDPKIQDLFEHLRNNPDKAQRLLQGASGELRQKIDKLVRVGLLQFQTG